jgi:hypothetical protein
VQQKSAFVDIGIAYSRRYRIIGFATLAVDIQSIELVIAFGRLTTTTWEKEWTGARG